MLYMLIRGDDNGQNFLVKAGMDAASAEAMFQRLRTGHKQWYTVCEYEHPEARRQLIQRWNLRM